jgi:hypothetical protein
MVGDTDDPAAPSYGGLSPEFHEALVIYALWKMGEYVQHEGSGQGEKYRTQYEGQDGTEGQIAWISACSRKRVTPQAARRRDLEGTSACSRVRLVPQSRVASPTSILADVRGWLLITTSRTCLGLRLGSRGLIPDRRGAKLEVRGPWSYWSSPAFTGSVWGGKQRSALASSS